MVVNSSRCVLARSRVSRTLLRSRVSRMNTVNAERDTTCGTLPLVDLLGMRVVISQQYWTGPWKRGCTPISCDGKCFYNILQAGVFELGESVGAYE